MPIIETTAYKVGELVFPTIQEAQKKEIMDLICGKNVPTDREEAAAAFVVSHTDEILAILTCKPATKKPRSDKGKKRIPKNPTPS